MATLKVGETVNITSGEWSDYSILGTVRVLREFDADALAEAWVAEQNAAEPWCHPNSREWFKWLLAEGYAEEADVGEHRLSVFS